MSHVFLAEEVRLGRKVVIKVLPPEMAAGVNVDRFEREILLAAKLQHPHIVPLLTAGSQDDLLYYVMPFIEGESLRSKLAREGELPVGETVRILKDVLDALSHAHEQGIVHRDIKPDNVMLAGRHAVVTDFGVAKAVASSTGESSLTSMGMALGTPAYMSPEQAAADPHVDHRADLYALGAMAYEMLTGRPPFAGPNAQAVLAAHITLSPDPVTAHRGTVPPGLAELVMRCLAKKPADRPQRADELLPQLDALLTPTGGLTPSDTHPVSAVDYGALAQQAHPLRVGALFTLAGLGVSAILYAVVRAAGLPDWVFFAGIGLLLAGFPVTLLTGHHERRRALARATGVDTMTPVGMKKLFTWRRTLTIGGLAFGVLAVVAAGFMTLRALGIGPFATLVSSGKLAERARILVADFENHTTDPSLGRSLTEAFRIDLSQSPVVRVMTADELGTVLRRMERPDTAPVNGAVAKEIAEREGIPAIITGDISSVGRGYVLSARVLASGDGSELAADRETADDATEILPALSRLTRSVRERIGESYRSLRNTKPLEAVTTSSLDALRFYTRGLQAEKAGDDRQAVELYRQATVADTEFAMAYRKLSLVLRTDVQFGAAEAAADHAFRLRDRLPPVERYLAEGFYYDQVGDVARAITAYRSGLAIDPDQDVLLNNLAAELGRLGRWAAAGSLAARALVINDSSVYANFMNLAAAQFEMGREDDAWRTIEAWGRKLPGVHFRDFLAGQMAYAEEKWDSVTAYGRTLIDEAGGSLLLHLQGTLLLMAPPAVQGRLAAAESMAADEERALAARGDSALALRFAVLSATIELFLRGNAAHGVALLDAALRRYPLDRMRAADRPWSDIVAVYWGAARAAEAQAMTARWARDIPLNRRGIDYSWSLARVLAAEGRYADARAAYQHVADSAGCTVCVEPDIARAWDAAGDPDSALAHYERYLATPDLLGLTRGDAVLRPSILQRAGELHEQLGHRERAIERYSQFVDLWKNADADLQPRVNDVRQRIARLTAEGG